MTEPVRRRSRPEPLAERARAVRKKFEAEWKETVDEARRRVAATRGKLRDEALEAREKLELELKQTAAEIREAVAKAKTKAKTKVRQTRFRLEGEARLTAAKMKLRVAKARASARKAASKIEDEARFIRTWIESPLKTGAVSPSSPDLAREMARHVDPAHPGLVVELGPGTGPVTEALVARGVREEKLILIEYDEDFCRLLKKRFPRALVVQGDAYAIGATLRGHLTAKASAVVSSLPLMTKPPKERLELVRESFALLVDRAPFIQFTYAATSPVPLRGGGIFAEPGKRVWRNIPPARVWVYRQG